MTITAKTLAHSITQDGIQLLTFELIYPRIVHAEALTHRVFSKNSASSRAIPIKKMNETILEDIAMPSRFGKANRGMQDAGEHDAPVVITQEITLEAKDLVKQLEKYGISIHTVTASPIRLQKQITLPPEEAWKHSAASAISYSNAFADAGYAKQVCNRLTEAYQHMKVVLTATEFDNWFNLRHHEAADPTIKALADAMLVAYNSSTPRLLLKGEWHMPYYQDGYWKDVGDGLDEHGNDLDYALKISTSQSAQVSFRTSDDSIEKARSIFQTLMGDDPKHSSPTEHQATPLEIKGKDREKWWTFEGVTHMDCNGHFWSGNLRGWIQHRQLIPGHDCRNYALLGKDHVTKNS